MNINTRNLESGVKLLFVAAIAVGSFFAGKKIAKQEVENYDEKLTNLRKAEAKSIEAAKESDEKAEELKAATKELKSTKDSYIAQAKKDLRDEYLPQLRNELKNDIENTRAKCSEAKTILDSMTVMHSSNLSKCETILDSARLIAGIVRNDQAKNDILRAVTEASNSISKPVEYINDLNKALNLFNLKFQE